MTKRATAFLLALLMVAQVFIPSVARAEKARLSYPKMDKELVEVGKIDGKDYPKLTNKVILDIQKQATKNSRKHVQRKSGATTFNTPYLPGQTIPDKDKPRIVGKVFADFKTKGLDGGVFDWEGVFGKDSNGKPGKAKLVFQQWLNNKETDTFYELEVSKDGKYSWKDWHGNPARIPLYSADLKPYTYSVYLDQDVSEKVKLLTYRIAGSPSSPGYEKDPETGLNVANIVIDLSIQQVASTKFISEWHTDLEEESRPPVEGEFHNNIEVDPGYFPFSKKDGGSIIIRNDLVTNSDYVDPGYTEFGSSSLVKKPEVKITEGIKFANENDEEGTPTYNLDEANKTITTVDKKHKFKYDFNYDVINGGKLTMTEVIPVTFDANGGKFASITEENAEQKIQKEVDYEKDLTGEVEKPTKDRETFKGWSTTKDGKTPITDKDLKNIKEAKTFYAIWDNNAIVADQLEVKESFKDGADYVNDFIPKLDTLKGQVKIKDASGTPQALTDDDKLEILDDSGNVIADGDLKDKLYEKLKEDDGTEVSRKVTLKARVTHKNKTTQDVEIPIKVIKNIYEAKTKEGKPNYVPAEYVKVTVDPTTKATDPQKYTYYVNPDAKVVIPGENPTGTDGNTFVKWTYLENGAKEEYKLAEHPRHQFKAETTIEAQYASDVIPQEGTEKPQDVPKGYVKVIVKPTALAKDQSEKIFWVKKNTDVFIDVKDPVPSQNNQNFSHWEKDGAYPIDLNKKNKFEQDETTILAKYVSEAIWQPGKDKPSNVPANYIKVIFDPTDKAQDTKEKICWVAPNKESVGIGVTNPKGKVENDAKGQPLFTWEFDQWELKGKITKNYNLSTNEKTSLNLNTNKIEYGERFKAEYKSPNIIPYNPEEPMSRPKGYVRVTFEAEKGLELTEQKAYYVRANAMDVGGSAIKLGNSKLAKPAYKVETGYEVQLNAENKPAWTPGDATTIADQDIVVKIGATTLPETIEKIDDKTEKPNGYVKVKFVAGDNGQLKNGETTIADKTYFVNPNKYVTLTPPVAVGNTGFEFGSWDKDAKAPTQYTAKSTTITASFNQLNAVVPKTKNDETEKPAGYKTVTFEIEGAGGSIVDGQTKVYYVDPNREVTINPPSTTAETGYEFEKWDQDTTTTAKKYKTDTTVKGNFKKLEDIIPSTNDQGKPNAKPEGYVTLTFDKGDHGKEIKGQRVYYVNPKANPAKTLGDNTIVKPTVKAETGYKFIGWDTEDTFEIKADKTVKAQYKAYDDVIPKTTNDETEKPEGYITVTFDKGEHGKELTGQAVYYVNPNKAVVLKDKAPTAVPNTGFTFADWDTSITKAIQYEDGDVIMAKYNPIGAVIPKINDETKKPAGYVTVTFDKGTNGASITGTTVYYVDPNKEVTVPAPTVTPKTGFKQKTGADAWDNALTQKFIDENTTITAQYEEIGDVIPQVNKDGSDKPNGYVTVNFKAVNGSLEGTTTYYVNGEKVVDLTNTANAITKKPNVGYKAEGTWDKPLKAKFADGDVLTFTFEAFQDVIEKIDENTKKPDGYVTVKLIPTEKATEATKENKVFFVNPNKKNVTIPSTDPVGKKITDANNNTYTFAFKEWTSTRGIHGTWKAGDEIKGTFTQDTDIEAKYNVKAENLINAPIPKKDVVTPKGVVPNAGDLIKNIPGSENDPLPAGTTFNYKDNQNPDLSEPGDKTVVVEVHYPNGKTTIVEVPIKVVDNVVPQTGTDKPNVPKDYVMVTYKIEGQGGKIADGETTIYYVNPKQDVTISQPKTIADTGYTFGAWDPDTTQAKKYERETTVKGRFTKGNDIIPKTNDDGKENTKPEGYVTVTFDKGANGKEITGETVYYVNPNAGKQLSDITTKPTVTPATGWKQKAGAEAWDTADNFAITADKTVTAQYEAIADVIPKTKQDDSEKPAGYITVTFSTEENGKIKGTDKTEKVVYVNPNKAVVLEGFAPEVEPNTGFDFAGWNTSITKAIQYSNNDVIKALYNEKGDVIPQEKTDGTDKPAGYLTVTFDKGKHGTLSGQTVYYVKPNKEVTVPAPTVTPETDYEFKDWDKELTQTFTAENTTITAQYSEIPYNPSVTTDLVETQIGKQPTMKDYAKQIHVPDGSFDVLGIEEKPDVSSKGMKTAKVKIKIKSGGKTTTKDVYVRVYVVPDPKIIDRPVPVPTPGGNQPNLGKGALNTTDHYQYLIGYPDGNFAPNKGMTRAEVATMFTRLLKERPVKWKHYNAGLSDIHAGDWYANTVGYAVQKGIVSGYPDGSFKPNKPITRAEFASIASRFDALAQGDAIAFNDLAPSHWGYKAIRSAASKGWISGYPDNTFRPEQAITRAEVTSVTNRMLNRYADLYWIDAHRAEVIRFGDVKRSDWYFEPIMEATMGHDFIRDRDGKTEHWTGVNGKSFI